MTMSDKNLKLAFLNAAALLSMSMALCGCGKSDTAAGTASPGAASSTGRSAVPGGGAKAGGAMSLDQDTAAPGQKTNLKGGLK